MVYGMTQGVVYCAIVVQKYHNSVWAIHLGGGNITMIDSCTKASKYKNIL